MIYNVTHELRTLHNYRIFENIKNKTISNNFGKYHKCFPNSVFQVLLSHYDSIKDPTFFNRL